MTSTPPQNAWVQLPLSVLLDVSLSPGARLVWAYLRHRQGSNGQAWPSLERIGADLGMGKATAARAVKELEKAGWLIVVRPQSVGRGHFCKYQIVDSQKGSEADHFQENKGSQVDLLKGSDMDRLIKEKVQIQQIKGPFQNCNKNQGNKNQNIYPHNSEAMNLSEFLLSQIQQHKPDFKKPNLQMWARHIDLMIRVDGRDPPRIRAVIEWGQKHHFWHTVILSTKKLREKFDQLEIQVNSYGQDNQHNQNRSTRYPRTFAGQKSQYGERIEV